MSAIPGRSPPALSPPADLVASPSIQAPGQHVAVPGCLHRDAHAAEAVASGTDAQLPVAERQQRAGGLLWVLALPLRLLVFLYQRLVSPLLPAACRYYPSCSAYAAESLARHGPFKGSLLAVRRVLRCHPWAPGGVDPVPR